jgi:DNA polymerase elongation subunit (family B)
MVEKVTKKKISISSFRLFDFNIYDGKNKNGKFAFHIQMFGINEQGESCSILVNDYKPFFYVKIGNDWNYSKCLEFKEYIKREARVRDEIEFEIVDHKKLYGFSAGKKHKFIKFQFNNSVSMNNAKRMWCKFSSINNITYSNLDTEIYESSIPPLLRYFHIENISPSGWVQISKKYLIQNEKDTRCTYEYVCGKSGVKPISEKETIVPFKICSFDIEASSSHGDFPVPIKSYKRLAMQIVELHGKHRADIKKTKALLERCVQTAFGNDNFEGIDKVYAIEGSKTTKQIIKQNYKKLLEYEFKDVDIEVKNIITISSMFARGMKDNAFDNENDNDYDVNNYNSKKDSINIIQILNSDKHTREDKINYLDLALTSHYPKLEGDKVTFIGSTFMKYGEKVPYLNNCLVIDSCDPVENVEIDSVTNETDLLLKWAQLIRDEDPDIIIGYNIFGFDYEFMFRRAQECNCEREFLELSRKNDKVCGKLKDGIMEIENTRVVLASGEYNLRYYDITGRLQIDMYTYFRRDYNLSSYKLDDVAAEFISDSIHKMEVKTDEETGKEETKLYTKNISGLNVNDYIHIEICSFTTDYYANGAKFRVEKIEKDENENTNIITIQGNHILEGKIKWTMAKDDVTPQDIFRLTRGTSSDRAIVAKYCIQDCNLVHHLMNKIDVLTGYIEMSSICSVPMSFLVFRGQGIKLTSYVAKKCREKDTLMPDLDKQGENEGYEGAIVLPPKCSMYMDNPVACVDYSSLYPSSMISQNYSHDSKVWTKEYNKDGTLKMETGDKDENGNYIYDNLEEYQYIDIEFDTFSKEGKIKTGKKVCRWAQLPNNEKSIMPAILEELLKARSATKKLMKKETDPFMENILDKRQLGYKVTANSLYGQCGARTSTFYEKDVAASTTATGRMMIMYAKGMIEEIYGNAECNTEKYGPVLTKAEYVYGDSVASYTPVYIRVNGETEICSIEEVAKYGNNEWKKYGESKECIDLRNKDISTWSDKGWTQLELIIRHKLSIYKRMYRVQTPSGLVDVTSDHSLLNENGESIKPSDCKVGVTKLLHKRLPKEQMKKYDSMEANGMHSIYSKDHVKIAKYVCQMNSENYSIKSSGDLLKLITVEGETFESDDTIIGIQEVNYSKSEYVYDLTTENHHFAAGIGNMVVHNTDSVFFTFNLEDPKTNEPIRGKKALEITIEIAQEAADVCTKWLKPPMNLEYEKTLMPFILLSKKRYVGMLYEDDPEKGKLKYMGLSLKRRDSCDYLKDTYGEILNILMKESDTRNVDLSIEYLNKCLADLIEGNVPMDKLAITRALRSEYKNPNQIAHRVLADRITQRDPGNAPKPGDRMKYVFIETQKQKALLGDRVETPEYIKENKLKIDYTYYVTNQLMKPLQQLYGLALLPIWETRNKKREISQYKKDIEELKKKYMNNDEDYMKQKEKYCSAKVKAILFDGVLTKINNLRTNQQSIKKFFN